MAAGVTNSRHVTAATDAVTRATGTIDHVTEWICSLGHVLSTSASVDAHARMLGCLLGAGLAWTPAPAEAAAALSVGPPPKLHALSRVRRWVMLPAT